MVAEPGKATDSNQNDSKGIEAGMLKLGGNLFSRFVEAAVRIRPTPPSPVREENRDEHAKRTIHILSRD